jgi:long-chain acyl-CoA synthetase
MEPRTLADLFTIGTERFPRPDRFLQKVDGAYRPISTEEFARRVRACAGALASTGVSRGDRVAILSYNRVEWAIADYACMLLGAADVPIYSTLPADQVAYILEDSGAKAIFVEDAKQEAKVAGKLPHVIRLDAGFEDFLKRGGEVRPAAVEPDDLATLIYTSGTTGVPKGVMLTHGNIVSNVLTSSQVLPSTTEDLALSFLPLSHIFERQYDYAAFWQGVTIAYAENVDKVVDNMQEVRPTHMAAVPRFYEKVYARILDARRKMKPLKGAIFDWARGVGAQEAVLRRSGARPGAWLALRHWLARKLVFGKLAGRVGGRIRRFVSGGAPLSRDVAEFLWSIGFTILEGYGLTETSPVLCVNLPGRVKLGTVGPVIPGVELKIAPDGEILARGPNIMKGYYNKPAETAEVLKDGWFSTGDIGELDADGYLKITDRKKDLLKTAGGKYIAPQPIENALKAQPHILNAVVIGDRRKFPAALLVGAPGATREQVQADLDAVNRTIAHHEQLKKFVLLADDFSLDAGEVTPTMKVKRRVVEKKYAAEIEALYAEDGGNP